MRGETQMGVDHEVEGDPRIIEDIVVPEAFAGKIGSSYNFRKRKNRRWD